VDDVVVKTKNPDTLIEDLKQKFENLKKWKWKLNPNKCVFRVPLGQLLRFLVRCAETDRLHDSPQSFHITTR
jgi:hypothetical protein